MNMNGTWHQIICTQNTIMMSKAKIWKHLYVKRFKLEKNSWRERQNIASLSAVTIFLGERNTLKCESRLASLKPVTIV